VGVGRDRAALDHVQRLGADAVVALRPDEDEEALTARLLAAAGPVDVVLDGLYGAPLEAALGACAPGARLVNIGHAAGASARIPAGVLRGRRLVLSGFAGLHTPLRDKARALHWLWAALSRGELRVAVHTFPLGDLPAVWRTQARSPHAKCVALPQDTRLPAHSPITAEQPPMTRTPSPSSPAPTRRPGATGPR
ncbi:zinc-binding dehydrogenase, partial [Streptomyces sp. SID11233]|nr:zinc-binding dehydrogenase [Streptomyces sp. SID11233]